MTNTPNLSSPPLVRQHARHVWQGKVSRLSSARLDGVGLALATPAEQTFVAVDELRAVAVRLDGHAIRSTCYRLLATPQGLHLGKREFDFDLAKGPGSDCRITVPRGWFETIVLAAVEALAQLGHRKRAWQDRHEFQLPKMYADFGCESPPLLRAPGAFPTDQTRIENSGLMLATRTVHHEGRRLLPVELVGFNPDRCEAFADLATVPRIQPCGSATERDLTELILTADEPVPSEVVKSRRPRRPRVDRGKTERRLSTGSSA